MATDQAGAYEAFVDHLLYSAEQLLAISDGWDETFLAQLEPHASYLCSENGSVGETEEIVSLSEAFREASCTTQPVCE